jgi:hypothetical protein
MLAGIYYLYRRWTKDRIVLYIFAKNRKLYKKAVRPTEDNGILHVGGRAYHYKEDKILHTTSFLLKELSPCLVYAEGRPDPIDLYARTPNSIVDSSELSDILGDNTVSQFVSAQSGIDPKQILQGVVAVGVISVVTVAGATWMILQRLPAPG